MSWQPGPDLEGIPDSWKVEIFQLDSLGNETNLLFNQITDNNFTRIPENLLNGKYGAKVSAIFGQSDVEGDIKYTCPGCWGDLIKSWTCNGPRYAYRLSHWESSFGFYYSLSSA
jgi:hypothetical protein